MLPRRYPISSLIRTHPPPQKARPVPRGLPVGWSRSSRLLGLPVLLRSPCAHMPPPIPRWNRRVRVSLSSPPIAAFPVSKAGRLPHQHFQGLLSVHYSLQPVGSRVTYVTFPSKASAVSSPPRLLRLLPAGAKVAGWVCLPLGDRAFPRRTSRPARASLMLQPVGLLNRPRRPLSRGFDPASYPAKPLVSYQSNRQFPGWYLPPLVTRAIGAHCKIE